MANTRANARREGDGIGDKERVHAHVQRNVPSLVQEKLPPQDPNYPREFYV